MKKYNYTLYCIKCNVSGLIYIDYTKRDIKHSIRFKKFKETMPIKIKEISDNFDFDVLYSVYHESKTKDEMDFLKNILITKMYKNYDGTKILNINPDIKNLDNNIDGK